MDNLEQRYRDNNLTRAELVQLKDEVNAMNDEDLGASLRRHWMDGQIPDGSVSGETVERMKDNIEDRIAATRGHAAFVFFRYFKIAAAVLLPLLLFSTLYLYKENSKLGSDVITFNTGKGEKATVTLPDGTTAMLNYDSRLVYTPKLYSKSERRISFGGEAYFTVSKNKDCPFIISADRLEVKVLGTKFNLSARNTMKSAELTLEEGHVEFTSLLTHEHVQLLPGQTAVLDYATGKIRVNADTDIADVRAWQTSQLVFTDVPLASVLARLQNVYGVRFVVKDKDRMGNFTGTLPTDNLHEALVIISESFHLKHTQSGQYVTMTAR
ncbi:FecR family protein [Prevotella sp. kh1p2]|uniref:FecR family protein n=1 Tax=Prevotella sp. kh1p2 TaxID=1761883 RepID=UPI0008D2AD91|nr:FecR domain-containing protein [Prevotella sp. kh1p2]SES85743.1 FecR family protein [Prevotella sp. kh1p2]SNU11056.1 FecR family protein [Prevotellaceae bacterium KH2P17]